MGLAAVLRVLRVHFTGRGGGSGPLRSEHISSEASWASVPANGVVATGNLFSLDCKSGDAALELFEPCFQISILGLQRCQFRRALFQRLDGDHQDAFQVTGVEAWAPFAKALQNSQLKYLNNLRLEHALMLRKEGRLESLRGFLKRVWKDASTENPFDSANAIHLGEELAEQIRIAEIEWKKIDADLLKIVGTATTGGLLAAGPLIAAGHAYFLAAASAVAGAVPLIGSTIQRRSFPDRFPAAFFMKVENK